MKGAVYDPIVILITFLKNLLPNLKEQWPCKYFNAFLSEEVAEFCIIFRPSGTVFFDRDAFLFDPLKQMSLDTFSHSLIKHFNQFMWDFKLTCKKVKT